MYLTKLKIDFKHLKQTIPIQSIIIIITRRRSEAWIDRREGKWKDSQQSLCHVGFDRLLDAMHACMLDYH